MKRSMLKGYNSDIAYQDCTYHVQTEDWGRDNPYFVSQVFKSGTVLKTIKISYTKVLPMGVDSDVKTIAIVLEAQHQSILDLLVSGQLI